MINFLVMAGQGILRFAVVLLLAALATGADPVRVGIYANSPKVVITADGRPGGIFIEVLERIAQEEGWGLDYRALDWPAAYAALRAGEIDILVDVAQTPERELQVHFTAVRVLDSWLDCFAPRELGPLSLAGLAGRRIAVLDGGVQADYLRALARTPGVFAAPITIRTYPSYGAVAGAVLSGEADALIASRFYAFSPERPAALEAKHIVLMPSGLFFATPPGDPRGLAARLDHHLANLKNDPASVYYQSLARWMDQRPTVRLPRWLLPALAVLGGLLLLFALGNLALRRQVRRQTAQLAARNAELQSTNLSLDAALAEVRLAWAEERLAVQRLAVAQRLEALGRLTGGVIHDFRNVLMVVAGSIELAQRQAPSVPRLEQHLRAALDATAKASALIDQLLAYTRRESSAPQRLELNAALRERERMLGLLVGSTVALRWELALEPVPVRLDPVHLDQIMLNLLGNARDAISGAGSIAVQCGRRVIADGHASLKAGTYAEITVSDTGCGIAPADLARVQEAFFTTKAERGGTGLGLATVAGILAAAGGGLHLTSQPGVGTTVQVLLPLAEAGQGPSDQAQSAVDAQVQ